MAKTSANFQILGGNNDGSGVLALYKSASDTLATIAASGYFTEDTLKLPVGSIIIAIGTDGTALLRVLTSGYAAQASSTAVTVGRATPGKVLDGTVTWDPGSLAAGQREVKDVTVTGAALGDLVICSAPYDLQGLLLTGNVRAADTVELSLFNPGTLLRGSATLDFGSLGPGDSETGSVTVTGAAVGDLVAGISVGVDVQDLDVTGQVVAADTVEVRIANNKTPLSGSATWDAGSIADGDEEAKEITVTGAALGDKVVGVSLSIDVADLVLDAQVTATDTVTAILANNTGGAIDLASATVSVKVAAASQAIDLASTTVKVAVVDESGTVDLASGSFKARTMTL